MKNSHEIIEQTLLRFKPSRDNVLKVMHSLQSALERKYFTTEMLDVVARYFKLTRAEVYGIATYYSMFSVKERGKYVVRVCRSPVCRLLGSADLVEFMQQKFGLQPHQVSSNGLFTLEFCECLGHCEHAPAMMINETTHTSLTKEKLETIFQEILKNERRNE